MSHSVYNYGLRVGLVAVGVLLAWSLGCQSEGPHSAPGALPAGPASDTSPSLNASTYYTYAHLLERQGNFQQAVQKYRQALELNPNFVSARNRLGITLNKLGQHAEASAQFRQAIRLSPTNANLHNNLGFSLYLEGRSAEALETFGRAIEIRPDFRRAHMNLGVVLARLGRYEEALGELRLATDEATAHYNLAVVQTEAGQFAAAARSLEAALHRNPNFPPAREQLHVVARLAAEAELREPVAVAMADAGAGTQPQEAPSATQEGPPPAETEVAAEVEAVEEQQPAVLAVAEQPPAAVESADAAPVAAEPGSGVLRLTAALVVARRAPVQEASFVGPPFPGAETAPADIRPPVDVGPPEPDTDAPVDEINPEFDQMDTPFGDTDAPFGDMDAPFGSGQSRDREGAGMDVDAPFGAMEMPFGGVDALVTDFTPADIGAMLDDLVEAAIQDLQAAYDRIRRELEQRLAAMEATS